MNKVAFDHFLFGDGEECTINDAEFFADRIVMFPHIRPLQIDKAIRLCIEYCKKEEFRNTLLKKAIMFIENIVLCQTLRDNYHSHHEEKEYLEKYPCPVLVYRLFKRGVYSFSEIEPFLENKDSFLLWCYFRKEISDFKNIFEKKKKEDYFSFISDEAIDKLIENEYKIDQLIEYGFLPSSIEYCLKYDDIEAIRCLDINDQIIHWNPFEWSWKPDCLDLLSVSGFFGSVNCFKYLLLNGHQLDNNVMLSVSCGGDNDIFHLIKEHITFSEDFLYQAAKFCQESLISYFYENRDDINRMEDNGLLRIASKYGHLCIVDYLMNHGIIINPESFYNAIELAAKYGHLSVIGSLHIHESRISEHVKNYDIGENALHYAASSGLLGVVHYLVSFGMSVDSHSMLHGTPLHFSAQKGHLSIVEYLVNYGADVYVQDFYGRDINGSGFVYLFLRSIRGDEINKGYEREYCYYSNELKDCFLFSTSDSKRIKIHFDLKTKIIGVFEYYNENPDLCEFENIDLWYPLQFKYEDSNHYLINYLFEHGADLKEKGYGMNTLLHIFASIGNLSSVEYLVNHGADVNAKNKYNQTPLQLSAQKGHLSIFEYLVNCEAEIKDINNYNYQYLLFCSALNGHLSIVEYLVNHGADINAKNMFNQTPLHFSALCSHLSIVEYLVNCGADVNAKNGYNQTLLHLSVLNGDLSIVEYLVNHGGDINAKNDYNQTLLHLSVQKGHLSLVEYLVNHGADVNSKNYYNQTLLCLSAQKGHLSIVEYLVNHEADINAKNDYNQTPLHLSAQEGHLSIVEYLVNHGAYINAKDKYDQTPLHLSAQEGHISIVEYLVNHGADINAKNDHNQTPLHLSVLKCDHSIVEYLVNHGANLTVKNNQ